ncbi:Haloacid dehalogenase-like hydrolase-domain-containing protein [Xylaria arbuscula]|nr:Haloacid dehalogenase-like hydrolase-domain-containing protein [Xylaria arbuscula]
MGSQTACPADVGGGQTRQVFFFDIDNCLYPKSTNVHDLMVERIDKYFAENLHLSPEDASSLHKTYFQHYGLAIEGLVRHHGIDPLEFNARVDDATPLEDVIKPRPELKKLLQDIDRTKVKLWLFTNAYVTHARRVVRLLEIEDMFEGLTFCNYSAAPFLCKPRREMFLKAMEEAGVQDAKDCFFVDDSYNNCAAAQKLGWTAAHLVEDDVPNPVEKASAYQISHLEGLRGVFHQFFKG